MRDIYYFISDIHLGASPFISNKAQENILVSFLEEIKKDAKELIIVGDLFDCWIEYRQVIPKGFYKFFSKLSELIEVGVKIIYLSGNHDFWKGDYFKVEFGIDIIHNPIVKEINGKRFYIHHGDGLAYNDSGYKVLRLILKNPVSQFLYSLLHPDLGIWLAKKTSTKSRFYTSEKDYSQKDGLRDYAIKKISEGFDFVVMGHRHSAIYLKSGNGVYINLGDWMKNFSYGEFKENVFKQKKFYDLEQKQIIAFEKREISNQIVR